MGFRTEVETDYWAETVAVAAAAAAAAAADNAKQNCSGK